MDKKVRGLFLVSLLIISLFAVFDLGILNLPTAQSQPPPPSQLFAPGTEFVVIHEVIRASGYVSRLYGFIPTRHCRYILDISCSSASIGIGGISFSLGSGSHQTVIVDSDAGQQKGWVSRNGDVFSQRTYLYSKYNNEGLCFTPYSATFSGSSLTVHNITQQINSTGLVTAFGSNKHQGLGYDGPHGPSSTRNSMEDIRNAEEDYGLPMTITIFADIDPQYIYSQLSYLQDRVHLDDWDLGIHFSFYNGNTWPWATAQAQMISEYNQISAAFGGIDLTTWSILGIGAYSANYKNVWVYDTFDMFRRSHRFAPQALTINPCLWNDVYWRWMEAWEQGYAAVPAYIHATDGTASGSHINNGNWEICFAAMVDNGVMVTGFANAYYMALNQVDATFDVSSDAGGYTITPTTNGYDANIVVKVNASRVTGVYQGSTPVAYSSTPENYVTFMVEDGVVYTVSTSTMIIIDSSMIDEVLTDFPLMVRLTDPATLTHNRKHINITTAGGTECYVEIESWDASEAILWVKVPSISNTSDTVLTMDLLTVDNSGHVGDTPDAVTTNVWSNGYASVFHMADANVYDSGPLRNDGIIHDTVDFVDALIGTGAEIKTTLAHRDVNMIEIPDQPEYSPINNSPWTTRPGITTGRICVQMIWQPEEDWPGVPYGNWRVPLGKQGSQIEYKFNVFGSYETYGPRRFYVFNPGGSYGSGADLGLRTGHEELQVGTPYLLHGQTFRDWDEGGGLVAIYEDGIPGFGVGDPPLYQGGDIDEDFGFNNYAMGQGVPGGANIEIQDTAMSIWVGNTPYYVGPPWSIIDEVRISTVNRNMAWMKAEYHNMNGELVEVIPPPLIPPSPPPPGAWAVNTVTAIDMINGVAASFFGFINGIVPT